MLLQEIATSGPLSSEIIGVRNGVQQQVELARKTGLPYSTFVRDGFDHNRIVGNGVLSRFPLTGSERLLLPNQDESSILKTQAVINGVVHHIYTMHPRGVIVPPHTRSNTDLAAEVLVQNVLALNPADMVIFGGDLNEAPDSYIANEGHLTETPASLDDRPELPQNYGVTDYVMYRGLYQLVSVEHRKPFGNDITDHAWHAVTLYEQTINALHTHTIDVPESSTAVDTGVDLDPNQFYELRAGGQIWAGVWFTGTNGPAGWNNIDNDPKFPLSTGPNAFPYSLIDKFGTNGSYFYVGRGLSRTRFTGQSRQRLFLCTNDDSPSNGNGAFTCRVVVSADPAPPAQSRDAVCVAQSVPQPMEAGETYAVSVTMKNTGTNTWTPDGSNPYRLGSLNSSVWGLSRVELPGPVAPNATVTFNFSVRAPWRLSTYSFQWRMVQEQVEWFGASSPSTRIRVVGPGSL